MSTSSWSLFFSAAALMALMVGASQSDAWQERTEMSAIGRRQLKQGYDTLDLYRGAYTDTTTQLRSAILDADLDLAISILTVNKDTKALGAGLRFPEGNDAEFTRRTPTRVEDPDVITIKAVAGASLRLGDCNWVSSSTDDPSTSNPQVLGILKLAQVVIISITPESGVFPEGVNQFKLQVEIITMLSDRMLMQQVLDDNPVASTLNRKLLVRRAIPVRAWFCSYCYPKKVCQRGTWWCAA